MAELSQWTAKSITNESKTRVSKNLRKQLVRALETMRFAMQP